MQSGMICGRQTHSVIFLFVIFHCFQLNLDETSLLCNEGELKIIGGNDKPRHEKNCNDLSSSITFLWVGSATGVNGTVIFQEKGTKVHPSLRGNNLVTKYGFPEGSSIIPNKAAYMDDETW